MTAVEVRVASDTRCPRCAARLCLTASIGGKRTVALCPSCDSADPHAERLLGYFAAHGSVQPQDMSHVSELLGHWLGSLDGREDPEPTLAAQVEAWWSSRPRTHATAQTAPPPPTAQPDTDTSSPGATAQPDSDTSSPGTTAQQDGDAVSADAAGQQDGDTVSADAAGQVGGETSSPSAAAMRSQD